MRSRHVTRFLVVAFLTCELIVFVNTNAVDDVKAKLKAAREKKNNAEKKLLEEKHKLAEHVKFEAANAPKLKDLTDNVETAEKDYWAKIAEVDQLEIDLINEKMKLTNCGMNCNKTDLWRKWMQKKAAKQYHNYPKVFNICGGGIALLLALGTGALLIKKFGVDNGNRHLGETTSPLFLTTNGAFNLLSNPFALIVMIAVLVVLCIILLVYLVYFRKRDAEDSEDDVEEGRGKKAKPLSGLSGGTSVMTPSTRPPFVKPKPSAVYTVKFKQSAGMPYGRQTGASRAVSVKPSRAGKIAIASPRSSF